MPIKDENMVLDQSLLLHQDNEEQDILNEFLDQRVFDSLNANTPDSVLMPQKDMADFHSDLFLRLKSENSKIDTYDLDVGLQLDGSADGTGFDFKNEPQDMQMKADNSEYLYVTPNQGESGSVYASPKYTSGSDKGDNGFGNQLDDYDVVRKELSNVKFGNYFMNPCPPTVEVANASYLDFSKETMSNLPYSLKVLELPPYSRVETQIKLKFEFNPAPKQHLLHVSQDLISKSKFCLQDPVESLPLLLRKNMLFMDTYVLTSDLKRSCNVCSRCIKREQKRALRSKTGTSETSNANSPTSASVPSALKNNPNSWADESMIKKAIIFNCKEIISFPAPTGLFNDQTKALDFSARIICYCRHHKEQDGFKLLFVVKDYQGQVVAKHLSSPIMIMDRKKNSSTSIKETSALLGDHVGSSTHLSVSNDTNEDSNMHPLSPNSIDDSTSEALANTDTNTDSNIARGYKRKKLSFDDSFNTSSNPMFNGGFSPLSNSDTNTSIHNMNTKSGVLGSMNSLGSAFPPQTYTLVIPRQRLQQQLLLLQQLNLLPTIQKIIPSQGPIRGGIEVTLLGYNFRPGLIVKFGSKNALATHCWSDSTIVTYLPPASQPGQVLVSFENLEEGLTGGQQLIFTYTDDTDRQLIELALQIVGLKMNGKLEDAKNIAKRIVGSDGSSNSNTGASSPQQPVGMNQASMEWYDNAHKAVEKLSRSDLSTEEILINFLSLVDLPNCPIIIPNWQLCNSQGQSLLHLATLKDYAHLIKFLVTHGCKIDIQDNQGLTPLFFASMCGNRDLINIFLECKSHWNMKLSNDKFLKDYCDLNVLDIFNKLESNSFSLYETSSNKGNISDVLEGGLSKSLSIDSLNSLYMMDYGKHISRMVLDSGVITEEKFSDESVRMMNKADEVKPDFARQRSTFGYGNESDFADSEFDSDDYSSIDENEYNRYRHECNQEGADYDDEDYNDYGESESDVSETTTKSPNAGLWQKVKNAVFSSDTEADLPSYDDLFPFGNSFMKPKASVEQDISNTGAHQGKESEAFADHEDAGVTSDSSEDMVLNFVNHPRKTVENDKMLLFFWLPVLVLLIGFFSYVSITGYKIETIEKMKEAGRNAIGNLVVGNERLKKVFSSYEQPLEA